MINIDLCKLKAIVENSFGTHKSSSMYIFRLAKTYLRITKWTTSFVLGSNCNEHYRYTISNAFIGGEKSYRLIGLEFYNKLTNNLFTLSFHKCHNLYVYRYWTKPHYYKKRDLWLGKCSHFMQIQLHDYVVNSNSLILP